MNPDPSPAAAEAPLRTDEPRNGLLPPASPESHGSVTSHGPLSEASSPPMRKDTTSSTSTTATIATLATIASNETAATAYTSSVENSPNFSTQAVFSVKDGSDVANNRRASRRRTGPLSALQRERAALIRKLGACPDCRRRRVACHPNHHNMTWEDAARKYRSHSPTMQELAPLNGRPLSPAPSKPMFTHDPQEMEIDSSPSQQQPGRPPLSEARIRTPLPSGPRLDRPASITPLPGIESLKTDLQGIASRVIADPYRGRYVAVQALLLYWLDDPEAASVRAAMTDLGEVLDQYYHYTFEIKAIPSSSDECKSSGRWLSREITDFVDNRDQRDVLKIVYYNGHTYLDGNRDMVLASSSNAEAFSAIRWSSIQQILEDACSDTLIVMDSAYYPGSKPVRQKGVMEVVAASASEAHAQFLDRNAFTQALTDHLRTRATQKFMEPMSAAELHARLLSFYPKMIQDRSPEKEMVTSFPSPLHILMGNARRPSILLAPVHRGLPFGLDSPKNGPQLNLVFRLADDPVNMESWVEWLRMMPEGVKEVKVDGPYRNNAFR